MAGVPPFLGFYAKLAVLQAIVSTNVALYIWLAVIAVLPGQTAQLTLEAPGLAGIGKAVFTQGGLVYLYPNYSELGVGQLEDLRIDLVEAVHVAGPCIGGQRAHAEPDQREHVQALVLERLREAHVERPRGPRTNGNR